MTGKKGTATKHKHVTYALTGVSATQATELIALLCLLLSPIVPPVSSPPELYGPAALQATVPAHKDVLDITHLHQINNGQPSSVQVYQQENLLTGMHTSID